MFSYISPNHSMLSSRLVYEVKENFAHIADPSVFCGSSEQNVVGLNHTISSIMPP